MICFSDWNKYLKTYLNTNLEKNRKKLLETLKDCLQPKDQKPDNRPDCSQLLQKINELTVNKSLLTEDNKTYEEFHKVLEKQNNGFKQINEKQTIIQTSNENSFNYINYLSFIVVFILIAIYFLMGNVFIE